MFYFIYKVILIFITLQYIFPCTTENQSNYFTYVILVNYSFRIYNKPFTLRMKSNKL